MIERRRFSHQATDPLIYWACERESIRKKKSAGAPPPWTHDPILQTYRFCNLRRRDDRVSQWLLTHVLSEDLENYDLVVLLKLIALCRWNNWPPTLAEILSSGLVSHDSINLPGIAQLIEARAEETKAWTGAYMVRAAPKRQHPDISKGKFVAEIVVGQGIDSARDVLVSALQTKSLRNVWEAFYNIKNWGSFMAGQVVADLSYTGLLRDASDLYTWAPVGPGSLRGHNRLIGLPLRERAPPEAQWLDRLVSWRYALVSALGQEYVDLPLSDVQNALCEVDKYLRVVSGEGRPRSKYRPETAY